MTSLIGCAETVYKTKFEVYCPSSVDYTAEYNAILANEIDALPGHYSALPQAITDYAHLRDKIAVCEREKRNL